MVKMCRPASPAGPGYDEVAEYTRHQFLTTRPTPHEEMHIDWHLHQLGMEYLTGYYDQPPWLADDPRPELAAEVNREAAPWKMAAPPRNPDRKLVSVMLLLVWFMIVVWWCATKG